MKNTIEVTICLNKGDKKTTTCPFGVPVDSFLESFSDKG